MAYSGALSVTNSIIVGNSGADPLGNDLLVGQIAATSLKAVLLGETAYQLEPEATLEPITDTGMTVLSDLGLGLGDVFAALDGRAPVLADNGGFVQTVALAAAADNVALAASAPAPDAFDADDNGVNDDALSVDARGAARGPGPADLGAYEAPALEAPSLVVDTNAVVISDSDGVTSLRAAIGFVESGARSGTITFDALVFDLDGRSALGDEALVISGAVTIDGDMDGDGAADVTLDAGGASRVLIAASGAIAAITGVIVTGGATGLRGGGIAVETGAALVLEASSVTGNLATGGGGIFVAEGGSLVGRDLAITDNDAGTGRGTGRGGGLLSLGAAEIDRAEIGENAATIGAGVRVDGGATALLNATVHGNAAAAAGGGVAAMQTGAVEIVSSTITGNRADGFGGGGLLLAGTGAHSDVASSIVAGNTGANGADVALLGADWALAGTVILGVAALTDRGAPPPNALVLDAEGIALDAVFAEIDGVTGGGLAADNGGAGLTVALAMNFTNPALDAGGADAGVDALGAPRSVVFLDPLGPDLSDLGAIEMRRLPLPDPVGMLPDGAPVLGALGAVAADLSGTAAQFNGAAFLNTGANDRLVFSDATSAAQFSHDGTLLSYDFDGDGTAEAQIWLGFDAPLELSFEEGPGGVSVGLASAITAIGEVAVLTVGTLWQTLTFANDYVDPVVFALAPSLNEVDAAATRFRNVTGTGAEIWLPEPKKIIDLETGLQISNAAGHIDETVTLLVLEKGIHTLEDGTIIQVGELSTSKLYVKGFEDVNFAEDFAATPSIFSQVQSFDGADYVISRQRDPDGSGFQPTMQEEQADNRNHAAEDVGWFAIEHGSGSLSGMDWQAGSSAQNVNGKLTMSASTAPLTPPRWWSRRSPPTTAMALRARGSGRSARPNSPPWRLSISPTIWKPITAMRSLTGWRSPPRHDLRGRRPRGARLRLGAGGTCDPRGRNRLCPGGRSIGDDQSRIGLRQPGGDRVAGQRP